MKLIYCRTCHDVIKLHDTKWRSCACGECGGHLLEDRYQAEYNGASAVPLGFSNSSLAEAIAWQPESGMGSKFEAFVIPKVCPTMTPIP